MTTVVAVAIMLALGVAAILVLLTVA